MIAVCAGFNPRAREGRDRNAFFILSEARCFNPRAREGRDPSKNFTCSGDLCFNPRAREGRDSELLRGLGL